VTSDTDQGVRQMDRNVMIVRDPQRLREMFASANIMQGFDPTIEEEK